MEMPFIGSDAVASGRLTPYQLRSRFVALYPDVYLPRNTAPTASVRALAAWLWTRRGGVLAGRSASALHGAKWLDPNAPAEIIWGNRHRPDGIRTWSDTLADHEVQLIGGVAVTTPARTALDIARRNPLDTAVTAVDALARATHLKLADADLLAQRHRGARGIRNARAALDLVDPGAESPRETWLRLLAIRAGFPRPQTQIPIYDEHGLLVCFVDMGWEGLKVAVEYDGAQHFTDARQFNKDIRRLETMTELGWVDVRVTSQDAPAGIIRRIRAARERRL
jgi:hypothetical protein